LSVLKGEGTTVMLYGSTNVSTGSRSHAGYLARPDLKGEWPTVVVVAPSDSAASSEKAICRHIARHGIAAVAPAAGGLDAYIGFITNPAGDWSNAEYGFGVLALGDGSEMAIAEAAASDLVVALALVDSVFDLAAIAGLGRIEAAVLGCSGREASEGVDEARAAAPQAEWVLYDGAGAGYWDIDAEGYRPAAADDTGDRVVEFLAKTLPEQV
jgi:hypothetical protein